MISQVAKTFLCFHSFQVFVFLQTFFTKFKEEFLPGFENRNFITGTSVTNILTRAKDFYMSKGTDSSYQILFKLLYGEDIELLKPIEQTLVPSANVYFKTKHVLLENLTPGAQPLESIGNFLYQDVSGIGTAVSYTHLTLPTINGV